MSDITELERRLSAALDRIGAGLDDLAARPVAAPLPDGSPAEFNGDERGVAEAEIAALQEALEAERTANRQLTERVRAIRERQETAVAALEQRVQRLTELLDRGGAESARLRRANGQLREMNQSLRAAMEQGLPEPHLINRAMMAELEGLRAVRAAEAAEIDEILSELRPLIGEVSHA